MDISEIRYKNAKYLVDSVGGVTAAAEKMDKSQSQLSHIAGEKPIKNIGKKIARQFEQIFNKPKDWLDHPHPEYWGIIESNVEPAPKLGEFKRIPVVGTAQLGDNGHWSEIEYPVGHGDGYIEFPSRDPMAYALRCRGDSMMPRIKNGEFVIVEPNSEPINGDEVLVKSVDGRVMVKTLLYIRDDMVHLMSVNESHPPQSMPLRDVEKMHLVAAIVKKALWTQD